MPKSEIPPLPAAPQISVRNAVVKYTSNLKIGRNGRPLAVALIAARPP